MKKLKKDWPDAGKSEKQIQNEVFKVLSSFSSSLGVFRNNVGHWSDGVSYVQYGLAKGSPDLVCILKGSIFVGIECKAINGKETKEQENWRKLFCERLGIYHILAKGNSEQSAATIVFESIQKIIKERSL